MRFRSCVLLAVVGFGGCSESNEADLFGDPTAGSGGTVDAAEEEAAGAGGGGGSLAGGASGAGGWDAEAAESSNDSSEVEADAAETPIENTAPLAQDLTVREVAVFQAVKISIAKDGASVAKLNSPILAGRKAVVRAYVQLSSTWSARPIQAELKWDVGGKETWFYDKLQPTGDSTDAERKSLFQFAIPAEQVVEEARLSVRLTSPQDAPVKDGVPSAARWPKDGSTAELGAKSGGAGIKLVLVPMRYDVDGSGRLPDTSAQQLKRYEQLLLSLYPLVKLDLTVHAPVPFDPGTGEEMDFDALNEQLLELKSSDGAPSESYYYGLVNPADTFDEYCTSYCTTGQSYVVSKPSNGDYRVGAGLGFTGEDSAITLAHELGHNHGRGHAPCDVGDADPFPYSGGLIGVWGFDPRTDTFQDPKKVADIMGYCEPVWVSDFTYEGLYERIRVLNKEPLSGTWPSKGRFLRLSSEGSLRWGRTVVLSAWPEAQGVEVRFLDASGEVLAAAQAELMGVSRARKSSLLIPHPPVGTRQVEVLTPQYGALRIEVNPE